MNQERSPSATRRPPAKATAPIDRRHQVIARYRPKSPEASIERLRQLAGIIRLEGEGSIPSGKFLEQ